MREALLRRGVILEWATVGWNVVEGVIAVSAGAIASSVALIEFGVDSLVETASGAVVGWRLGAELNGRRDEERIDLKDLSVGVPPEREGSAGALIDPDNSSAPGKSRLPRVLGANAAGARPSKTALLRQLSAPLVNRGIVSRPDASSPRRRLHSGAGDP